MKDKYDKYIRKSYNVTALLYHIVFPVKYRRKALTKEVSETLKITCIEISKRFEIHYIE
ncbi:transposase, partial [Patescibacteria group bacterium]|nr:transposase [Patescibacteria group bacterium]